MKKFISLLAIIGLTTFGATSQAASTTIDFDALGPTGDTSASFVEDGYNLDLTDMYIGSGSTSTPDIELERLYTPLGTNGFLAVSKISGGAFTFDSIDFETEYVLGQGFAGIAIEGFFEGISLGIDVFESTALFLYETFASSALSGLTLDSLLIFSERGNEFGGSFDTLVLSDVDVDVTAVPVPAALFMFAPALLAFFGLRRRATTVA